jgi:hypothetical protein
MLKYYEYLHRIRSLLRERCSIEVLANLEAFPIDLDPSLREYHEKIVAAIERDRSKPIDSRPGNRYYIHRTKPFFVGGRIYYEVTFFKAVNKVSKFDRVIAFTDIDMTDKYAATLTLESASITVLHQTMPITIIRGWQVSIRPCEFNNFARLFDIATTVRTNTPEYRYLMKGLTVDSGSLLDLMDLPDDKYAAAKEAGTVNVSKRQIFPALDEARRIIRSKAPGHNMIRYLMLRMHNQILKPQYYWEGCARLSGLNLQYGCIPFDDMPFCTSPIAHNPRYWDLAECLDATGRDHELLARRVKNNVEHRAVLYTPVAELEDLGDVSQLINTYNRRLYYKHRDVRTWRSSGTPCMSCMYLRRKHNEPPSRILMRPSSGTTRRKMARSVFYDIADTPEEAANITARSLLMIALEERIKEMGWTQTESNCQELWMSCFRWVRVPGFYRMWESPPSTGSVIPVM